MFRTWYVLHVKPRTEKKVASYLAVYKYWYVLPTWTKVTKVQRRKVRRELPIFPGYVFTRLNPDERVKILKTNLLVSILSVPRPREMIHQLRQVVHASRHLPDLKPVPVFKEGDPIRIVYGPFRGIEGYVKRTASKTSLVLNIDMLGEAREISIDPGSLEHL